MASSKKAKISKTLGDGKSSSSKSSSSSSKSSGGSSYVVKDTKTGEVLRTVTSGVSSTPSSSSKSSGGGGGSSSSSGSFESATQAVNLAVQKLVEQKQAEEKKSSGGGGTVIRVESSAPEDIGKSLAGTTIEAPKEIKSSGGETVSVQRDFLGQPVLQSTTLDLGKAPTQPILGPQKTESVFKQPLVSEPESITVQRGQLAVSTSSLPTDEKGFLLKTARDKPSAFSQYQKGTAEVKRIIENTPSKVIMDQTREVQPISGLVDTSNKFLSPIVRTPDTFMQNQIQGSQRLPTEQGFLLSGQQEKTTLTLQPLELDKIKQANIDRITKGQEFLAKTGLAVPSEDIFGQQSLSSSTVSRYKPSEEVVLKSFAEFENTTLRQKQLNKQIEEFNARPSTQQDDREYNALLRQSDDLKARYRMNPFVKEQNGGYVFESPIESEVLAQQVSISQRPDVFVPYSKVQAPSTQFGKGFQEALAGKAIYEPISSEPKQFLGRYSGVVAGSVASPFIGAKSAVEQISRPLENMGVSKPIAERVSEATLFGATMAASAPVGGAIGRGIGTVAGASSKVASGVERVERIVGSKPAIYGMGALAAYDIGAEGFEGYKETGSIGGGLAFGAARTAELGSMAFPLSAGIKGYKEGQALRSEREGEQIKQGVDVLLTKGYGTSVKPSESEITRFVSESEGIIKIPGQKDVPVKVYTGAEGKQSILSPEVPEDVFRITGGKVKVEFPGTSKKPIEFTTDSEYSVLPSDRILGKTSIYETGIKQRTAKDFILEESARRPDPLKFDIKRTYTGTSLTEKIPGKDDSSLLKTFFVTQERPKLLSEDVISIGESTTFQKTPVELPTALGGSVRFTESEFATGSIQASEGKSLSQTLKDIVGKPPGFSDIPKTPVRSLGGGKISDIYKPVGGTSIVKSTSPVKTPIGKVELKTPSTGATKEPITSFNSRTTGSRSALETKQVMETQKFPVSETQQQSTLQRLRQIVGEKESAKYFEKARGIREQPVKFGQTIAPITTSQQMRIYQEEKTKMQPQYQITQQKFKTPEQQKLREFIQTKTPIQKQISEEVTIQDKIQDKDRTFSPITEIVTMSGMIGGSTVKTPERAILPVMPGMPKFGGDWGFRNGNKFLAGIKTNPIEAISKSFGKGIRGLK